MIKFRSEFQFKIYLQFYRTAEKVTKIKLVMVMVKSFDKYHHLFNLSHFGCYLVFSLLRFTHTEYKGTFTNKIFTKKDIVQE